jgi:recombinational DNA repair protein RecR
MLEDKKMNELKKRIIQSQINFHILGGNIENEIIITNKLNVDTHIVYKAIRNNSRGYSLTITKETISIANGYKQEYIGTTHGHARETFKLI